MIWHDPLACCGSMLSRPSLLSSMSATAQDVTDLAGWPAGVVPAGLPRPRLVCRSVHPGPLPLDLSAAVCRRSSLPRVPLLLVLVGTQHTQQDLACPTGTPTSDVCWCSGGVESSLGLARRGADLSRVSVLVLTPSSSECTMYSWARTQAPSYTAWVHDRRVSTLRTPSGYVLARMSLSIPCTSPHWAFPI